MSARTMQGAYGKHTSKISLERRQLSWQRGQQLGKEFFEFVLNEAFGAIPQDVSGLAERLPKDLRNQDV